MQLSKEEIETAIEEQIKAAEKQYGKSIKITLINIIGLLKMLNPEHPEKESRLIPLAKWNDYHPYPTVGSLYQYKFKSPEGFKDCLVQNGVRILIDETKFFEWLHKRNNLPA